MRARRCLGAEVIVSTTCPHCALENDDADHALNRCNLPVVIQLTKTRHDDVAHFMIAVIKKGNSGSHHLHSDARNKSQRNASPRPEDNTSRKLPAAILPLDQQHSFPDITMIDAPHEYISQMLDAPPGNETVPEDIRLQSTVDLIEIKYTYDLLIHERVRML